jgi:hypothetical protein
METKVKIFQNSKGAMFLLIGNNATQLSLKQINDLHIESRFYEIEDFDNEQYAKYYNIKSK